MMTNMQRMNSDPFSANATSQLSSDFKSAASTSPLEHRLHHKSRLDRTHSESMSQGYSAAPVCETCLHSPKTKSEAYKPSVLVTAQVSCRRCPEMSALVITA